MREELEANQIELTQRVAAPIDLVWQMCASARGICGWQADEAEGEAKPGGSLTLHWVAFGARVELTVVDMVRYERLVFRHGESIVEFRFDNQSITLTHRGLSATDDAEGLTSSWKVALAQLAHCVERHPGRQRRVQWIVRNVRATPESIYLAFTDPNLLTLWLTSSGGIPEAGEDYEMWLKSGQHLTGRVLAHIPGRDVLLRCDNVDDALLTFRTFPSPTEADERLVAFVWSEWGPPSSESNELAEDLEAAMERLANLLSTGGDA